jgi:exopolysaccharide production protein ExoZ
MRSAKIESVQALRAAAALSVAILHALQQAIVFDSSGIMARGYFALPWGAGVDLFFVISGFVMVYASDDLFGRRGAPALFMSRRLIRIVPLYWVVTTLFLLAALAAGTAVSEGAGNIANIVMSYAFLPTWRPDGEIKPIYSLGWTLNYEMLFYVVFAACIWQARRRALVAVTLILGIAIALHGMVPPQSAVLLSWTDPIMAEFLFGMAIAAIATAGLTLRGGVRAGLVLFALLLLLTGHLLGIAESPQPVMTGVPMAMLVAAAVLGQTVRVPRALLVLGDASYALYLVHPFPMWTVRLFWRWLHLSGPIAAIAYVAVSLLLAAAAAVAVYECFERPVGAWLRTRLAKSRIRQVPLRHAAT